MDYNYSLHVSKPRLQIVCSCTCAREWSFMGVVRGRWTAVGLTTRAERSFTDQSCPVLHTGNPVNIYEHIERVCVCVNNSYEVPLNYWRTAKWKVWASRFIVRVVCYAGCVKQYLRQPTWCDGGIYMQAGDLPLASMDISYIRLTWSPGHWPESLGTPHHYIRVQSDSIHAYAVHYNIT